MKHSEMNVSGTGATVRKRVSVTGVVQGVGYRFWALSRAREMELSGFVRNMPDGSVELVLQGPEQIVLRMIELCSRGPSWASVRSVTVEETQEPLQSDNGMPFRVTS